MIAVAPFTGAHLAQTLAWMQDESLRAALLVDRTIDAEAHRAWYASARIDPSQKLYVLLAEGAHIGNFSFRAIDPEAREADLVIYLGPDHRGRGWGRPALEAGLEAGRRPLGLARAGLVVRADNGTAIRLYSRAGFTETNRFSRLFRGAPVEVVRMVRAL